jgi:hypothetical protein
MQLPWPLRWMTVCDMVRQATLHSILDELLLGRYWNNTITCEYHDLHSYLLHASWFILFQSPLCQSRYFYPQAMITNLYRTLISGRRDNIGRYKSRQASTETVTRRWWRGMTPTGITPLPDGHVVGAHPKIRPYTLRGKGPFLHGIVSELPMVVIRVVSIGASRLWFRDQLGLLP